MKLKVKPTTWIVIAAAILILGLILGWWKLGLGRGGGGGESGEPATTSGALPGPADPTPCRLRLDLAGLTLDGKPIDPAAAVIACRGRKAEVRVSGDAPYGRFDDLRRAFRDAKLDLDVRDRPAAPP